MSQADRSSLEHRLAAFLGFDDAVSDIFDQLLTIDTSEDLLEYLSQLLGDDGEKVKQFVHDVERFKRGDALTTTSDKTDNAKESTKPKPSRANAVSDAAAEHRAKVAAAEKEAKEKQKRQERERELERQRRKEDELQKKKKQQQQNLKQPIAQKKTSAARQKKSGASIVKKKSAEEVPQQTKDGSNKVTAAAASVLDPPPPENEKPTPPQRGKAKKVCGCFGTKCKPLTNCLHCGRIACEKEGYGYCPFCGYLIEKLPMQMGKNKKLDKALLHKERLLKFDREFTRRTVILDDQADYFSNTTSSWLTEDEQIEAEERDQEKRREMHERKKQVMNVAF